MSPPSMRLAIFGRVDLDGTHRAVIEGHLPELERHLEDATGACTLLLSAGETECACLLAEYRRPATASAKAAAGRIFLDRFKMRHLDVRDGDEIALAPAELPIAEAVELRVPGDFGDRDAVRFIGKPLARGERTALYSFSGDARPVTVALVRPTWPALVTPATEIRVTGSDDARAPVSYDDIGGLEREVEQIREVVEYPLRHGAVFTTLGVSPPRGILLHGPPGTGKTLIARALACEAGARFYPISGPEVYSRWYGRSEENLRNIFAEAVRNAPSIVVIDELDALVPRRERAHGDQEQRIVATFLTQMDGLAELRDVVVVGTTNRLDAIDPALRRGGRFEHEVYIGPPSAAGRRAILDIHARRMPLAEDVDLDRVAESTGGFVGADIAALCREAAYNALRRAFSPADLSGGAAPRVDGLRVTRADFEGAIAAVPPSASREFAAEIPRVGWDEVGGLDEVRAVLTENITYAVTRREAFERAGVRPASGVLLHGPPGTGKTLLAQAVAHECWANFIALKGPELRARWLGEAEGKVRLLFRKARSLAPCVVFFDEVDAALPVRGRDVTGAVDSMVNQLLAEMDGIDRGRGVFVMAATNRLEQVDPAALRPGRFDLLVEIGPPDRAARRAIFGVHLEKRSTAPDVDADALAAASEGLTGADIAEACRAAAFAALRASGFEAERVAVDQEGLLAALAAVRGRRR